MNFIFVFFFILWFVLSLARFRLAISILPLAFLLYMIKFQLFGIPFTVVEMMVYLSFLAYVLLSLKKLEQVEKIGKKEWLWPLLLFLLAVIFSLLIVPENISVWGEMVETRRQALGIFKGWILMPLLFFLMWYSAVRQEKKNWYLGMRLYVISALVLSFSAFYQVFTGSYIHYLEDRASGPFTNANYLSLYLGPAFVFLLIYLIKKWKRIPALEIALSVLSLVILALAIYFSKSYACWIAIFGVFVVYFLFQIKKFSFRSVGVVLGALLLVCVLFWTQIGTQKFDRLIGVSSSARIEAWKVSLDFIKENPISGIGLWQFEPQYKLKAAEILGKRPYELSILHPHNIFLAFWLNTGILGLIAFLWFLTVCFWKLKKNKSLEVIISCAMLFYIVLHGFFDTPFWKNDLALQFFMISGGILALSESESGFRKFINFFKSLFK